jgi:dTDP-4-dehydrorhamnose reductase
MPALVFGQTGQVAQSLRRLAPDVRFVGRAEADFTNPAACAALVARSGAQAVINAVAYTAVDAAEEDEALATIINGDTPGALARACAAAQIPLVHISTDYVFDGNSAAPFTTDHPPAPLGAYGRSKLAGEQAVRAAGGTHAILRTSWVISATGRNFVKTMLHLGATRETLTVVADQTGGPTCADDIARACLEVARQLALDPTKSGTYHFSGAPDVSWAQFARAIFDQAGLAMRVTDITSAQFPTPAARPHNSCMDNTTTQSAFGIARPDWRSGLAHILAQIKQSDT